MISWHKLLDEVNVPWKDAGRNTSRGNVNVCCPACGDDYGYHLSISLTKQGYYCYRNPNEHSGTNFVSLLRKLTGFSYHETKKLISDYSGSEDFQVIEAKVSVDLTKKWDQFDHADTDRRYTKYLTGRGFLDAEGTIQRFGLKHSPAGKWAQRLLLPIIEGDNIVSWTGRAIRPNLEPKYLTSELHHGGMVYIPRYVRAVKAIIVEGPLDALKLSAALPDVLSIALAGKALNASKLLRIRSLIMNCHVVLFAPDSDVGNDRYFMLSLLKQVSPTIDLLDMPQGYKDAGDMPEQLIRRWAQ